MSDEEARAYLAECRRNAKELEECGFGVGERFVRFIDLVERLLNEKADASADADSPAVAPATGRA